MADKFAGFSTAFFSAAFLWCELWIIKSLSCWTCHRLKVYFTRSTVFCRYIFVLRYFVSFIFFQLNHTHKHVYFLSHSCASWLKLMHSNKDMDICSIYLHGEFAKKNQFELAGFNCTLRVVKSNHVFSLPSQSTLFACMLNPLWIWDKMQFNR